MSSTNPRLPKILYLNKDHSLIGLIPWQRAVSMLLNEKVIQPHGYEDVIQIRLPHGKVFPVPTAVILVDFKKPRRKIKPVCTPRNIFFRDKGECQYCGTPLRRNTMTLDHVVPKLSGGRHHWGNIVACCHECNTKKGSKSLQQAGMKLRNGPPVAPSIDSIKLAECRSVWNENWIWWISSN